MATHAAAQVTAPPAAPAGARRLGVTTAALVAAVVLAVHGSAIAIIGASGWDDGAITFAFARTFAGHGTIALTPVSEEIEGFSSPAWFLVMVAVLKVFPLSFSGTVLVGQLLAAACAAGTAVLLLVLLRGWTTRRSAALISILVGCSGLLLNETVNGMEMSALAALVLAIVLAVRAERFALAAGLALTVPLVRLEAAVAVLAAALVLAAVHRRARRGALAIGVAVVVGVAAATALRLGLFGSWLPNTMLAKRWPPYTPEGFRAQLRSHVGVARDVVMLVAPAAAVAIAAWWGNWAAADAPSMRSVVGRGFASAPVVFAVGFTLGSAVLNVAIGTNSGYRGRMELAAVAPLVAVVVFGATAAYGRSAFARRATAAMLIGLMAFVSLGQLEWHRYLSAAGGTPAAESPELFRRGGDVVEHFADLIGAQAVSAAMIDVGGAALCCSRIRVVDLGMLTNHELAAHGYDALDEVLAAERPDVIETHDHWSDDIGIYAQPAFRDDYVPVSLDNFAFWTRRDLLPRLPHDCSYVDAAFTANDLGRGYPADEAALVGRQVCVLDGP